MKIDCENFIDKNKYGRGEAVALYFSQSNGTWLYTITQKASTGMFYLYKMDSNGEATKISSSDYPYDFEQMIEERK